MREIYFRAKPCYMGGKQPSWVYGTFQYIAQRRVSPGATDNGTLEPRQDKGRITDIYGIETEVLCDTVCQFTGCLDKEKRRIYEGDIIECVSWNEYWTDGMASRWSRCADGCWSSSVTARSSVSSVSRHPSTTRCGTSSAIRTASSSATASTTPTYGRGRRSVNP